MRTEWLFLAVPAIMLAAICPTTTAERYALLPREATTSAKDAAAVPTIDSTASSSNEATPTASSDGMSSPSESPARATNATGSSSTALATATPIAKGSLNVNGTTTPSIEGLPIHPKITPALAVAGSILILSGTLYALIGIKTKWLHIFLSTAYVFALAVTILIEFVMHTPVSNAAQGAYVAAACLTGLVAGGGALLFQDVTQGISLVLGGFCFSMWVLTLRPGGTITSTTGKIIFISCLTIGAPALYLSPRIRPYGLIASTSFAGATATVLGIDCFCRAGLKEFWLYIWNINNEIFPLHYEGPYPITRGIQAETGAIVIICAMGIMSQMRVWKMIKGRQEQRTREQRRKDEEDNLADEEHGRRVELAIRRERVPWEAANGSIEGGKTQYVDSGIGLSTRSGSFNDARSPVVPDPDSGGIELHEMDAATNSPKEVGRVIVHATSNDEVSPTHSATGQHLARPIRESREPSIDESQTGAFNVHGPGTSVENAAAFGLIDKNLTLKPRITHLPFKVPHSDFGSEDGRSSVAASAASDQMADRRSKRLSGSSIVRKLSQNSQRIYVAASSSEEAFIIAASEDDKSSSIAATMDGVSENDDSEEEALSLRDQRSSFEILRKQHSIQALIGPAHPNVDLGKDTQESPSQKIDWMISGDSQAEDAQHVDGSIDPAPESIALPGSDIASATDTIPTVEELNMDLRASVALEAETPGQSPRISSLRGNLPQGSSRVVTVYRTNEWAKHLDGADLPELDGLEVAKTRAPDSLQQEEYAAPVDARALQQTPLNAEPDPILTVKTHNLGDRPVSYFQSKNPFYRQQNIQEPRPAVHSLIREKAVARTPSQTSLENSMEQIPSQTSLISTQSRREQHRPPLPKFRSSPSFNPSARAIRRSSLGPMANSRLVDSPIEEDVEASFPIRSTRSSANLMTQRDLMLRHKPTSTSKTRTSWPNLNPDQHHPALRDLNLDDKISLSQRKSLLQQRPPHAIPQTYRSSSAPDVRAATPIYAHIDATAIHPRNRSSLLAPHSPSAAGRPSPSSTPHTPTTPPQHASLQTPSPPPPPPPTVRHNSRDHLEVDNARRGATPPAAAAEKKRRDSHNRQEQPRGVAQAVTQNVWDRPLSRGGMLELHQQQMRKMQAEANRSLALL